MKNIIVSKNDNIMCQGKVYHIQTEFYKATNKIICNIFKEGTALKKIEKKAQLLDKQEIIHEISILHLSVIKKMKEHCNSFPKQGVSTTLLASDKISETKDTQINTHYNKETFLQSLKFEHKLRQVFISFDKFIEEIKEIESYLIHWQYLDTISEFYLAKHNDFFNVKNNLVYIWNKNKTFFNQENRQLNSVELIFKEKIFYLTQTSHKKHNIVSIIQLKKDINYTMFKHKSKKFFLELF